jgi:hypothetical protein
VLCTVILPATWNDEKIKRSHGKFTILIACAIVAALLASTVGWLVTRATASGDPGGTVMKQLTPVVTALPGSGTASLPWVKQIPQSLESSYAITIEPFQDSCDGIAGTQGWSQVVVQAGFIWWRGLGALETYVNPRLKKLGWQPVKEKRPSIPPDEQWIKILKNGSTARLSVEHGLGEFSHHWQMDALANPIGKRAGGC